MKTAFESAGPHHMWLKFNIGSVPYIPDLKDGVLQRDG